MPVVAANRIGLEENDGVTQSYLRPFLHRRPSRRAGRELRLGDEGVLVVSFDLGEIESYRAEWGFFRDRRTDLYAKTLI